MPNSPERRITPSKPVHQPRTDPRPAPEVGPLQALAPTEEFLAGTGSLGLEFDPGDLERLGRFLAHLLAVNDTHNLTAITDPHQAWMKHIFDALTLVPVIASHASAEGPSADATADVPSTDAPGLRASSHGHSVIDIGSGGGVPAIPLAIVMPDVKFTLVEATGKKVAFLNDAIGRLGLGNARVIQARAETLGQDHKAHREKYDIATARALGRLAVLIELCGPLVKPGGLLLAVKGAKADEELVEAKKAMGEIGLKHIETITTPTGRVVVLEKTTRTPRLYPRRDGEPARKPLGVTEH